MLHDASLEGANLSHAQIIRGILGYSFLNDANLEGANLNSADLNHANLSHANLTRASLTGVNLYYAYLLNANLDGAQIQNSDLSSANLAGATLRGSLLRNINLSESDLYETDFSQAVIESVRFGCNNLSTVKGLDTVHHLGPSTIGIDTLYISTRKLPESFLRGCGIPEIFINQIPTLIGAINPIEFYSCFISYSSKDQKFADKLHTDLQGRGVRCWFAPEHLEIGARMRVKIDETIRGHDKLLLILSKNSIASEWVEKEVETAMERERQQKRTILFPIRLDDEVMAVPSGWAADIRRSRNIGDFKLWGNHDSYKKAFDRLLRDLKAEFNT
jgi:hypothetical protein